MDIQVFLSIKELKKRGYSLKEIGELTPFFYPNQVLDKKEIRGKKEKAGDRPEGIRIGKDPFRIYGYYQQTVVQRLKEQDSEEARYKKTGSADPGLPAVQKRSGCLG